MKILQISTNWGHGGPGGVVKDIHYTILSAGEEGVVAYGRFDIPECVPSIKIGGKWNAKIHGFLTRIFDCAGFASRRATKKFLKEIDVLNPDILHLHNLLGYYIDIKQLFAYIKKKKIPVVWTVHDCWAFTGHCINFESINCDKWKTLCHACPLKKEYPQSLLFDNSKRNFKRKQKIFSGVENMTLVAPSKWLATHLKISFLNEYPIEVFPNGIDLSVFKPTPSDIKERYGLAGKKVILSVASEWNRMKGEHIVYELVDLLDEDMVLVMIGHKQQTKENSSKFLNLPKTNDVEELAEWYSAADAFVNPTLGDNFPTVNIEALACGTPVITNNTGGAPEAVENERLGRIVYDKTAQGIKAAMDDYFAKEQGIKPETPREKYDKTICNEKYIRLYKELLEKNRR